MKPRIVFFAATSLVATGITLASNLSFGQRAGKLLADVVDTMGPISSLMSGIVRPNFDKQVRVTGDYAVDTVADARQDVFSAPVRNQPMGYANAFLAPGFVPSTSNAEISNKITPLNIQSSSSNVSVSFDAGNFPKKPQQVISLLEAFAKGAPGSLAKDREDVWQFLNSRPGQFDTSKLILSNRSERVDKEFVGNRPATAVLAGISDASQINNTDTVGTVNANNLTAQSLLSKNSVASVPVPASSLVLVAGFASLFGVSFMAKKSKAKKSKKAAK